MARLYLLFILFALLQLNEARHHRKSHHKQHHVCKHKATNIIFRHFYEDIIEVDEKEEKFCNDLDGVILKEYYGTDLYKLIVPMKNASEEDLKIKIHHRALLVEIEDKFSVIRNLPQIVNPKNSSYVIDDGDNVVISFYYNIEFEKELEVKCDNAIENTSSFVPKAEKENETEDSDVEVLELKEK
ncbi:hypothetical protein NE865_03037 [Phthorimaea operculella]|nr:hypothetical protein NE865_03037 [Phthorimaea operculella]